MTGAWYVIHTKPYREAVAHRHLAHRGLELFYPQLVLPAYARPSRRCVPLFPGYLFVRVRPGQSLSEVRWTPGVRAILSSGGVPTPLDDALVAFLQRNTGLDGRIHARCDLRAGQEVEILDGPFAGLVVLIQDPPDTRGRIRILMTLLNRRDVTVLVPVRCVRAGWVR